MAKETKKKAEQSFIITTDLTEAVVDAENMVIKNVVLLGPNSVMLLVR